MASEERDRDMALEWLRECVAIHDDAESPDLPGVRYALALVEATPTQPRRAMLGEVVEALERAEASLTAVGVHSVQYEMGMDARQVALELRDLLTKLRALTATEGGTNNDQD